MWPINFVQGQVVAPTVKTNNGSKSVEGCRRQDNGDLLITFVPVEIDIAMTALKLKYSDDSTNGTDGTWTDLDGSAFGTAYNESGVLSVLPGAGDDGKMWHWYLPKARRAWYQVYFTVGAGVAGVREVVHMIKFAPSGGPINNEQRGGLDAAGTAFQSVDGSFLVVPNP